MSNRLTCIKWCLVCVSSCSIVCICILNLYTFYPNTRYQLLTAEPRVLSTTQRPLKRGKCRKHLRQCWKVGDNDGFGFWLRLRMQNAESPQNADGLKTQLGGWIASTFPDTIFETTIAALRQLRVYGLDYGNEGSGSGDSSGKGCSSDSRSSNIFYWPHLTSQVEKPASKNKRWDRR